MTSKKRETPGDKDFDQSNIKEYRQEMKRDKFDESLRGKLEGYEPTLPEGGWERIESSLASGTQPALSSVKKEGGLRRPLYKRIAAVAAVFVVGAAAAMVMVRSWDTSNRVAENRQNTIKTEPKVVIEQAVDTMMVLQEVETETYLIVQETKQTSRVRKEGFDIMTDVIEVAPMPESDDKPIQEDEEQDLPGKNKRKRESRTNPESTKNKDIETPVYYQNFWGDQDDRQAKKRRKVGSALYAGGLGMKSAKRSNMDVASPVKTGLMSIESLSTKGTPYYETQHIIPEKLKHAVPISVGINFNSDITDRLSSEAGVQYTYLRSDFEAENNKNRKTWLQQIHYVGIPLALKYDIVDTRRWAFYVRGSVKFEWAAKATGEWRYVEKNNMFDPLESREELDMDGIQSSLAAGVGAELKLSPIASLYIEPAMEYYFDNGSGYETFRTHRPLMLGVTAGMRINFVR